MKANPNTCAVGAALLQLQSTKMYFKPKNLFLEYTVLYCTVLYSTVNTVR